MTDALMSLKDCLRDIRRSGELEVHERVDLRAWTALRVGGVADLVIRCHSVEAVQAAIDLMAAHGVRWLLLGSGCRVIPSDRGLRSPALSLSGGLARWQIEHDSVVAGTGANLTQLRRSLAHAGLRGLARTLGDRTTLGGALFSAARSQNAAIRQTVAWVELARPGVKLERVECNSQPGTLDWPRVVQERSVLVRCKLHSREEESSGESAPRRQASPRAWLVGPRTVDQVFENAGDVDAGDLLEQSGCGGLSHGGVRVADGSANAITSTRTASSGDVVRLVRTMRERVLEKAGVDLSPTLYFVDEDGRRFIP